MKLSFISMEVESPFRQNMMKPLDIFVEEIISSVQPV